MPSMSQVVPAFGAKPSVSHLSRFCWCVSLLLAIPLAAPAAGPATDVLRRIGAPLQPAFTESDPLDPARAAGEMVGFGVAVLAVVALAVARRRHSRITAQRSRAAGRLGGPPSVTVGLTMALWSATLLVGLLTAANTAADTGDDGSADLALDVATPEYAALWVLWLASLVAGSWAHVRRYQIEPLSAGGGVVLRTTASTTAPLKPFLQTYWIWLVGLRTTAACALGQWLSGEYDGSFSDLLLEYVEQNSLFPTVLALMCLGALLVLPRCRQYARAVLAHPRTRWCLVVFCAGLVLHSMVPVVGNAVILVGSTAIAATSLQLVDRGPQPWLGLVFLASQFFVGLQIDGTTSISHGSLFLSLPTSFLAWVGALLGALSAVDGARKHVLAHLGTRSSPPGS